MNVFLGFVVISFFLGFWGGGVKPVKRVVFIILMCLLLSLAYFSLNQI